MKSFLTKFAIPPITEITGESTQADDAIVNILNAVIGALAIVCVIVVVIGGIQYMTSNGDASKVKKGKDTILYALIGLAICALAAAIVNFVITSIINTAGSTAA